MSHIHWGITPLHHYTVAEYVESPEIDRLLKICGVDKVQGHYVSESLVELPNMSEEEVTKQSSV